MRQIGYRHIFIAESTIENEFPQVLQSLRDKSYNEGWYAGWEAATEYFENLMKKEKPHENG